MLQNIGLIHIPKLLVELQVLVLEWGRQKELKLELDEPPQPAESRSQKPCFEMHEKQIEDTQIFKLEISHPMKLHFVES